VADVSFLPRARMIRLDTTTGLALLYLLAGFVISSKASNVLLGVVDDGGLQSPVFGDNHVDTPNLQALAKRSVIFRNAFTSASSGSPSRAAMLTGKSYRVQPRR